MSINTILSSKVTDTGSEPITAEQAKLHASIDYTDYDSIIPIYISAARIAVENATGLALVDKTVKLTARLYSGMPLKLPYSPVKQFSYAALVVQNAYGQNVWSPSDPIDAYGVNDDLLTVATDGMYEIEFTAGYANVPADLKLAILQMFTFIFNHRGEYNEGKLDTAIEAERIIINNRRFAI